MILRSWKASCVEELHTHKRWWWWWFSRSWNASCVKNLHSHKRWWFCSFRASKVVKNLHAHTHTHTRCWFWSLKSSKKLCQEFAYTKHTKKGDDCEVEKLQKFVSKHKFYPHKTMILEFEMQSKAVSRTCTHTQDTRTQKISCVFWKAEVEKQQRYCVKIWEHTCPHKQKRNKTRVKKLIEFAIFIKCINWLQPRPKRSWERLKLVRCL